jgi:hypothetical protein
MNAVIIKATGEKSVVEFTNETAYEVLSGTVGGLIQCVSLPSKGLDLWVNEEGKLIGLPQNPIGTALWSDDYGLTDVISGDIIFTGGDDDEGRTLGLTDEQVKTLISYNRTIELVL